MPGPRHSFRSFKKHDGNAFALAGVRAAATDPGCAFNPVLVHGDHGSGKTHLLEAAARLIRRSHARQNVLLTTGKEFVKVTRAGGSPAGPSSSVAVLVDDVEAVLRSRAGVARFTRMLRRLHAANVQVILTSRAPPSRLGAIYRAVQSLEWGMTVGIEGAKPGTRTSRGGRTGTERQA